MCIGNPGKKAGAKCYTLTLVQKQINPPKKVGHPHPHKGSEIKLKKPEGMISI
jgi:hypothetical protein